MADDKNTTKTMDINDLVRELSKSSTTPVAPTPPPAPSSQAPKPSFPAPVSPTPKPFIPTPAPSPIKPPMPKPMETPRPQFTAPLPIQPKQSLGAESRTLDSSSKSNMDLGRIGAKPVPPPSAPTPPPAVSGVKEYQSSIRTMSEDISNIKQGQKPTGIDVPRKVEQLVPTAPQPMPPKLVVPSQQFKVPSINLGETKKTGPLTQSKDFSKPAFPTPPPVSSAKPAIPVKPLTESKTQIYVPQEGQKMGNRDMLFLGIGAVALVVGFAYWFFIIRAPAPEVVIETPTPTATSIPTPTPTLQTMFSGVQKESIIIKANNQLLSFVSDVMGVVIDPGAFKILEATDAQTPPVIYNFSDLVAKLTFKVPAELISNIGNDSAVFVYGQRESFDAKGNLQIGATASNRIVIVAELTNPSGSAEIATNWETSLGSDLKALFTLGKSYKDQTSFTDNSYRNTNIRFWNFPYADRSIDYSMIVASNGKTYFVITNSREAMFGTIDKLKGF